MGTNLLTSFKTNRFDSGLDYSSLSCGASIVLRLWFAVKTKRVAHLYSWSGFTKVEVKYFAVLYMNN